MKNMFPFNDLSFLIRFKINGFLLLTFALKIKKGGKSRIKAFFQLVANTQFQEIRCCSANPGSKLTFDHLA